MLSTKHGIYITVPLRDFYERGFSVLSLLQKKTHTRMYLQPDIYSIPLPDCISVVRSDDVMDIQNQIMMIYQISNHSFIRK